MRRRVEQPAGDPPPARLRRFAPLALAILFAVGCSTSSEDPREKFVDSCIRDCVQETGEGSVCDSICNCIVRDLGSSQSPDELASLLRSALGGSSTPNESARLRSVRERCRHRTSAN